jgi:hypothetical protein
VHVFLILTKSSKKWRKGLLSSKHTVVTEIQGGREVFDDYYVNKKTSNSNASVAESQNTPSGARSVEDDAFLQGKNTKNSKNDRKIFYLTKTKKILHCTVTATQARPTISGGTEVWAWKSALWRRRRERLGWIDTIFR